MIIERTAHGLVADEVELFNAIWIALLDREAQYSLATGYIGKEDIKAAIKIARAKLRGATVAA